MHPGVQRALSVLVRSGSLRTEDAIACVREAQTTRESPLAVAVRRGLVSREAATRALDATRVDLLTPPAATPPPVDPGTRSFQRAQGVKTFGPYEIVRPLGEGGMGIVYEARDNRLGRHVALKVLHGDRALSKTTLARFEQEARAAARLKHPNICGVYEVGSLDGVPYFTMELVPGVSLAGLMAAAVPWRRTCEVVRDAARGLQHAHEQGIVHRDVKPSNILVDEQGHGRLVDFGLAIDQTREDLEERLTRTGQFMGTPHYLAPECIEKGSRTATRLSDIYALGVTLYEAVSGLLPFREQTAFKLFQIILAGEPAPPDLPPGTPADVAIVALKAMAREPSRRYATADALACDLERILRGQPIVGRPPTASEFMRSAVKKPAFLSAVAAAVAVVSLLVVVIVHLLAPPLPPRTTTVARTPAPPPAPPPPPPPPAPRPASVVELIARARAALWTGDLAKARAVYQQALALDSKNPDARLEDLLVASLELDLAAGTQDAALAVLQRKDTPLAFVVAETGLVPGVVAQAGDTSEEEDVDLGSTPVAPLLRIVRAQHLLDASDQQGGDGDFVARAEQLAREAVRDEPRCGVAAAVLAEALVRQEGEAAKALALLEEDRDYEGASASLRAYVKGLVLVALERPVDAEAMLRRATAAPWCALARSTRAAIWHEKKDWAAVVSVFDGAEPASVNDWVVLAHCLAALGRHAEARKALDTAVALSEEGGDVAALLRALGRSREERARAVAVRGRLEALVTGAAEARGERARFAARDGDTEVARRDVAKLLEAPGLDEAEKSGFDVSPIRKLRGVEAAATRAAISIAGRDWSAARRALETVASDPENDLPADASLDLARCLAVAGDVRGAVAACDSATTADPTLEPAARKLLDEVNGRR